MKHSYGNLMVTILPILILASLAVGGWYYYSSTVDKYESLEMDSQSKQGVLNSKLKQLQTTINQQKEHRTTLLDNLASAKKSHQELTIKVDELQQAEITLLDSLASEKNSQQVLQTTIDKLQQDEIALQARLLSEKESQQQLQAAVDKLQTETTALLGRLASEEKSAQQLKVLLEKSMEQKMLSEASLQQEVNRVNSTTAELEAELEKRRLEQESLNDEISTVSGEKSQLLNRLEQEQQSKSQIANLKNRLEQELNESRVEISQLKNQMTVIKLTSEVLFNSGSAEIKPAGKKVLSIIAESLNTYPHRDISVEGHTDNVPVLRNTRYESNWELSAARGLAAVNYFQQNNRVDPKRLKVVGYGQYHPVSSNETAEGRKRNRRIEIRLLPAETAEVTQN